MGEADPALEGAEDGAGHFAYRSLHLTDNPRSTDRTPPIFPRRSSGSIPGTADLPSVPWRRYPGARRVYTPGLEELVSVPKPDSPDQKPPHQNSTSTTG